LAHHIRMSGHEQHALCSVSYSIVARTPGGVWHYRKIEECL